MCAEATDGPIEVMIVEDTYSDYLLLQRAFTNRSRAVRLVHVETLEAARAHLARSTPTVMIIDVELPDGTGLSLLDEDLAGERIPTVVMTSHGDEETAARAMRLGAMDYAPKSANAFARMPSIADQAVAAWRALDGERTRQREAMARVADLNAVIAAILDTAEAAILVLGADLRILRANRFCEELSGVPAGDAVGMHIHDYRPCTSHPASRGAWSELPEPGAKATFEDWWKAASGECRLLSWSNTAVHDVENRLDYVVCVGLDITEARRAEEEARQEQARLQSQVNRAQRLESIGVLAGGIAHDFNNALSAIVGYTELARDHADADGPIAGYLAHVTAAAARSASLVRQILAFSRMSEQEPTAVQLQPVVSEALEFIRASAPSTIEIREAISSDLGAVVADATQMHQVVMNLCTNAVYAMNEAGGLLLVTLEHVDVDEELAARLLHGCTGPHVRLAVRDTGSGISPEIIDRVFDPFFTTKPRDDGTGLGLATTYGIVQSHGGAIAVASEVGVGTEFSVYLPYAPTSNRPESFPARAAARGGTERILLVEDEEPLARVASETLEGLGYVVTQFTDSQRALAAFAADPYRFDLVVTDHTMPRLTGLQLAARIAGIRPGIPVILCSGGSAALDASAVAKLGTSRFLAKPYDKHHLADMVRAALDRSR